MEDPNEELCSKEQISKVMSQILAPGRRLQELMALGSYLRVMQRYFFIKGIEFKMEAPDNA